jgi:NADH-quinone oxidoreductase subunit A
MAARINRHYVTHWYKGDINQRHVLRSYLPVIVFLALGGAVALAFATLNSKIGPRRAIARKHAPYECGLPSEVKRGMRFGISFYLIAMLFILFDIEVVFLYPIAIELRAYGGFALAETIVFVALLFAAFLYVWRRGALQWK